MERLWPQAERRGSISCLPIRPETHRCWWVGVGGVPARRYLCSCSLSSFLRCSGEVVCPGHTPRASGQRCPQSQAPGASARRGSPTSPPTPVFPAQFQPLCLRPGGHVLFTLLWSHVVILPLFWFSYFSISDSTLEGREGSKSLVFLACSASLSHGTPAPCEALGLLPLLSDPAEAQGSGVWMTDWAR